jgi:hypothetical protein
VADVIKPEELLRTEKRSLAEIEFEDKSITRLGSMSVFLFKRDTREFYLETGLSLICVRKDTGGGRIVTSAITAAIEGTTVLAEKIVVPPKKSGEAQRAGAKIIFLEGHGIVSTPDGRQKAEIHAGQMIIQIEGEPLGQIREIDLRTLVGNSDILNGFGHPLFSWPDILAAIAKQQADFNHGLLEADGEYIAGRGAVLRQYNEDDVEICRKITT